ncbi:NADH-quinone oxidoreductase subunit J family protein [Rariglobus hedericola]|uniref:NADH-quinone oxidoreductase subunit J n=1 Tax=Rariglobus hedericola TaxID=2597822 RepID=A0A556QKH1_9BACT|nr:NADH-quinone oxidoreductase subunit J [Rariglobus hedericola]TSJ77121.1 NADH-quinone oxidoreductase subunit J [Rariglobus hedericola]
MSSDIFFYFFAALTAGSALAVVLTKNTVASALSLLVSLVGVAAIFVLLDAFLLAALMVFVYAGAVVALFLFIVMLLDSHGGDRKPFKKATIVAGAFAFVLLVLGVFTFAKHVSIETPAAESSAATLVPVGASLRAYGEQLFTTYLLPVQIVGFLLLIAMLGVIVLSKKFEGLEDVK